jgi:hypothetical protein
MHDFTQCVTVSKGHGSRFSLIDYSPFTPYVEPEIPPHGTNQRLKFKKDDHDRTSIIKIPGGKRVRVDIVGEMTHPIWCAIYTRVTSSDEIVKRCDEIELDDSAIQVD